MSKTAVNKWDILEFCNFQLSGPIHHFVKNTFEYQLWVGYVKNWLNVD